MKAEFSSSLLQLSVSHEHAEIILICLFIIVGNSCADFQKGGGGTGYGECSEGPYYNSFFFNFMVSLTFFTMIYKMSSLCGLHNMLNS